MPIDWAVSGSSNAMPPGPSEPAIPSSIFAFSVGAGKLTRTMQPSLPSAVQRLPPLSVDASSPSRLRAA